MADTPVVDFRGVRPVILEELIHAMRQGLYLATQQTNATVAEVNSAVFSFTLRNMQAVIDLASRDVKQAYATRKELTILCEKLWVAAAGEPFLRDKQKKVKSLPH